MTSMWPVSEDSSLKCVGKFKTGARKQESGRDHFTRVECRLTAAGSAVVEALVAGVLAPQFSPEKRGRFARGRALQFLIM